MKAMRLRCPCGRNLADVRVRRGMLAVEPRPGVDQLEYRDDGDEDAPGAQSYRWPCPHCRLPHTRRHDRLVELWQRHEARPEAVVHVTLDQGG